MTQLHERSPNHTPEYNPLVSDVVVFQGRPDHSLYEKNLDERLKFIIDRGWVSADQSSDADDYDQNPQTLHIIAPDEDGSIVSSLRLTPVSSVVESISFSMLAKNPSVHEEVHEWGKAVGRDTNNNLWDLTRLIKPVTEVPPTRESYALYAAKTIEAICVGIKETNRMVLDGNDPLWMFVSDEKTLGFLQRIGVQAQPIAGGQLSPGDDYDSYFCVTSPHACLDNVYQNPDKFSSTIPYVERGLGGGKRL